MLCDWHVAKKDLHFGKDALRNGLMGDGERSGMRRVTVHDALNIGAGFHDLQVQEGFTRTLLGSGELLASHIDEANVLRFEEPFAVHRRSAEHLVLADAIGDVAVVRGGEAALVETIADFADLLLHAVDIHGREPVG